MPERLYDLCEKPRGLVLVTGPTGSGKSTTLAALIDRINADALTSTSSRSRIRSSSSTGTGAASSTSARSAPTRRPSPKALRAALRQDPDVILVGEMRDLETISTALTAAETGHLVFATLHTQSAPQTIDRIIDVFPAGQQAAGARPARRDAPGHRHAEPRPDRRRRAAASRRSRS